MPHWTDLVTLTIQHRWRLSLPPLENAIPRARNRLSLIIASLLRTVAPHRFHPRYWQCSLLITLSRPRIAIVASGSRALHVCMQRCTATVHTLRSARIRSGPTKARKALVPHNPTIQFHRVERDGRIRKACSPLSKRRNENEKRKFYTTANNERSQE